MDDTDTGRETDELTGSETDDSGTETCDCCGSGGGADFEYYATKVRLESESSYVESDGESSVLEAGLPDEFREAMGGFLGGATVETLGDWVDEIRRGTGGGSIALEDLCHEDSPTGHWGDLDGERYHFTCFFDAVVLAALTDRRVDVRTESPGGTVIEATATGDGDLTVSPPETLVSFGVSTGPGAIPEGKPTHEDVYAAVCPVVKAFPSPQAYEQWAEAVPAATVAMPLEDATELATALTEGGD